MFAVGQYVFYQTGGVCRISEIRTQPLPSVKEEREYYILRSVTEETNVTYVPLEKGEELLRPLIPKEKAENILSLVESLPIFEEENSKKLRILYKESLVNEGPEGWLRVVKTVYKRKFTKISPTKFLRISETERSLCDDAQRFLYAELAFATDRTYDDVAENIGSRLNALYKTE